MSPPPAPFTPIIVSSGLNGVGASVVNALSDKMIAEVYREGFLWKQEYKKMCKEQILSSSYYNKINKNFIDWDRISIPTEVNRLGPKHIERISERDKHPSEKGQQQIARLIYDGLG